MRQHVRLDDAVLQFEQSLPGLAGAGAVVQGRNAWRRPRTRRARDRVPTSTSAFHRDALDLGCSASTGARAALARWVSPRLGLTSPAGDTSRRRSRSGGRRLRRRRVGVHGRRAHDADVDIATAKATAAAAMAGVSGADLVIRVRLDAGPRRCRLRKTSRCGCRGAALASDAWPLRHARDRSLCGRPRQPGAP
jgi:hypothetical protein